MSNIFKDLLPQSKSRPRSGQKLDNEFSRAFRELRLKRGLSQKELAAEAEVGLTQIRKIEQGQNTVTLTTLNKLTRALGARLQLVEEL